jgi:DNA-binding NarL/FixJ family response regulator
MAERTEKAASLAEALRKLTANPRIDLIMLDLSHPDAGHTDALETLQSELPKLPLLATSGTHACEMVDRYLQAGAMRLLPKSLDADSLARAVHTTLKGGMYLPPEIDSGLTQKWWQRQDQRLGSSRDVRQLGLTERQTDVLKLFLQGMPNKLIGRQLQLAEGTVKVHVSAVLRALGVRNRTQAVLTANRLGLKFND